ncbi:hypothetical protein V6N13_035952 [Hibiscus sabdariffa]
MDAALLLSVLFLAMTGHSMRVKRTCRRHWTTLCENGADCNPTHSNGPCYNPNTDKAHCNYAVNSYFQRKGQAQGSCFAGYVYPSSASGRPTPTTLVTSTTTPTTMNPRTNTPTGTTPYGSTTPTGVLGGINTGLGSSGTNTTNTDYSHGGLQLQAISSLTILIFSGLMLSWG